MKKIPLLLFLLCTFRVDAQVFQARDVSVGLGSGLQTLSYTMSDTAGYRNYYDGVTGINFNLRAEYGIASFMGIGMNYSYSRLLSETKSPWAYCALSEFAPEVTYHIPWSNRFVDLSGAAGLGLSAYSYQSYEENWARARISATMYFAELRPRFYFSEKNRLGAFLSYRFTYYTGYGDASDKTTPRFEYDAIGHSHLLGVGVFYRFGKSRAEAAAEQ